MVWVERTDEEVLDYCERRIVALADGASQGWHRMHINHLLRMAGFTTVMEAEWGFFPARTIRILIERSRFRKGLLAAKVDWKREGF
jgi:hypothetical protein